nr:Prokaryotic metallothionein [Haloechinothrix aidingensis]
MAFEVRTSSGHTHVFDSIECAAQRIAPECEHCRCRVLGHGVEVDGRFFCCAHCARSADAAKGADIRDAVGAHPGV